MTFVLLSRIPRLTNSHPRPGDFGHVEQPVDFSLLLLPTPFAIQQFTSPTTHNLFSAAKNTKHSKSSPEIARTGRSHGSGHDHGDQQSRHGGHRWNGVDP